MAVEHRTRAGKTYYLHETLSSTGRKRYHFSLKADGILAGSVPDGFEIYEDIAMSQVFLRKIVACSVRDDELALVARALRVHSGTWKHIAEAKTNAIVVHEARNAERWSDEVLPGRASREVWEDVAARHATYEPVLKFILADEASRVFSAQRWCFRGSGNWIWLDGAANLADLVDRYVPHLGQEAFFDLPW